MSLDHWPNNTLHGGNLREFLWFKVDVACTKVSRCVTNSILCYNFTSQEITNALHYYELIQCIVTVKEWVTLLFIAT